MSNFKIGFILDTKEISVDVEPNTSYLLMQECCYRNHDVFAFSIENIFLNGNNPEALAIQFNTLNEYFQEAFPISLNDLDLIVIRQDPPINLNYIFSTYILDYVDQTKTVIINSPSGIRKCNEKVYINNFPQIAPQSLTTSNIKLIKNFINEYNEIIIKPLDNYAGNGIFYLKKGDKNLNSLLECTTNNGKTLIIAQEYLKNVTQGDKRLVVLGGEPVAAIKRISAPNDFRANMCKGGSLQKAEITDNDREICNIISKDLLKKGLFFVGLDIIDDKLIEINVTSPGFFIRKINSMFNIKLEKKVVDYMESLLLSLNIPAKL